MGCHTVCLTSCVWEFKTVTHSYSSSSSTVKHMRKEMKTYSSFCFELATTAQPNTNLPRSRHSCLGYMLPTGFLKVPTPHIWPHFHVPPTQSSSGKFTRDFRWTLKKAYPKVKVKNLIRPQNHRSSFSRCRWLRQSWQRPGNYRRETTPLSSQYAGVHPGEHSYISKRHLKVQVFVFRCCKCQSNTAAAHILNDSCMNII